MQNNIKVLTLFNFFTDFRLYAPIAIIYFANVTGSYALGMSIFSITTFSSALFEVPTGVFSDFLGRKKTIVIGAVFAVIYSVFYAIGGFYWILALGAIFQGLSIALYSGNNDALLYDTLLEKNKEKDYAEYLGKVSAMFQVGLGLAAVAGGFLATWSFSLIMWISAATQVICLLISFMLIEPKVHSRKSGNVYVHIKEAYIYFWKNKKLRLLSISSILGTGLGEASYQFQAAFYSTLWPIWAIGVAKALSNLGATISFHFSGRFINKFGAIKILIWENIYNRVIGILATAIPTVASPILLTSSSVFFGVGTVAKNDLMQKEFTNEQRATMSSLNSLMVSIFFGVVAVCLGLIADEISPAVALLSLQILQFSNLFIYLKLFKHHR